MHHGSFTATRFNSVTGAVNVSASGHGITAASFSSFLVSITINCKNTLALVEAVAREKDVKITLEKVEDLPSIMNYGVCRRRAW